MTREEEWVKRNRLKYNDSGASIYDETPVSVIKWQKGKPTEGGRYLTTFKDAGEVSTAMFIPGDAHDEHFFKEYVAAWCKLSDIEPYKEEAP